MKVLALIPDFIQKPGGGLGEQFKHLYNCLKDKVDFYVVAHPEVNRDIKNFKYAVNPIPLCGHPGLSTAYGQAEYFLKALEFGVEFDVIHSFDWSTAYGGCLCSWHFKKPLISSINLSPKLLNHSNIPLCYDPNTLDGKDINSLMEYIEELGLIHANKIITVSDYYANIFKPFGNISVIKNGLQVDDWVQKRAPKLPGKNKTKVCYIGRASTMKGIDTIVNCDIPEDIDFYFIVSKKSSESKCWESIKNKVNNRNIFHIPGLYDQDKIDFLFSMDGVVMPSTHEPFGIVALEALISNNVFITTNTGGIREITEDVDILQINNSQDLSQALMTLRDMTEDVRYQYHKKGVASARKWSWDKIAKDYYNIYCEVSKESHKHIRTTYMLDLDSDTLA
jgi:glycosyltransferase involved in cell wall biosynthesis